MISFCLHSYAMTRSFFLHEISGGTFKFLCCFVFKNHSIYSEFLTRKIVWCIVFDHFTSDFKSTNQLFLSWFHCRKLIFMLGLCKLMWHMIDCCNPQNRCRRGNQHFDNLYIFLRFSDNSQEYIPRFEFSIVLFLC